MRLYLSIIFLLILSGCASAPRTVSLSSYEVHEKLSSQSNSRKINSFRVVNKAPPGKLVNKILGETFFPLDYATTTNEIVSRDLNDFLNKVLSIDGESDVGITATILKADSYFVLSSIDTLPFIGILAFGADKEFGMNLKVLIEIEKKGKVISNYLFDDRIIIQGSIVDEGGDASYRLLIDAYRKRLFTDLEANFLGRYI